MAYLFFLRKSNLRMNRSVGVFCFSGARQPCKDNLEFSRRSGKTIVVVVDHSGLVFWRIRKTEAVIEQECRCYDPDFHRSELLSWASPSSCFWVMFSVFFDI